MNDPHDSEESGMPRWVRLLAIAVVLLALLIAVVMLIGGGEHGPARHFSAGADPATGISAAR